MLNSNSIHLNQYLQRPKHEKHISWPFEPEAKISCICSLLRRSPAFGYTTKSLCLGFPLPNWQYSEFVPVLLNPVKETPWNIGSKAYQYINIAIRTKVPPQDRAEQRKFADLPAPAKIFDFLFTDYALCSAKRIMIFPWGEGQGAAAPCPLTRSSSIIDFVEQKT